MPDEPDKKRTTPDILKPLSQNAEVLRTEKKKVLKLPVKQRALEVLEDLEYEIPVRISHDEISPLSS